MSLCMTPTPRRRRWCRAAGWQALPSERPAPAGWRVATCCRRPSPADLCRPPPPRAAEAAASSNDSAAGAATTVVAVMAVLGVIIAGGATATYFFGP